MPGFLNCAGHDVANHGTLAVSQTQLFAEHGTQFPVTLKNLLIHTPRSEAGVSARAASKPGIPEPVHKLRGTREKCSVFPLSRTMDGQTLAFPRLCGLDALPQELSNLFPAIQG
jgi:hypothetical protein